MVLAFLKRESLRGLSLLILVFARVVGTGLLDLEFEFVVGLIYVHVVLAVVDLARAVAEMRAELFVLSKEGGTWKVRLFIFWMARMAQLRYQNWITMLLFVRMQFYQTFMLRRSGQRAWFRCFQSYLLEQPQGIPIRETEVLQKPYQNFMFRKCLQLTPQRRLSGVSTASLSYLLANLMSIEDLLNLEQDSFLILSSRASVTDFLRWGSFSSGTLSNSDFFVLFPFLAVGVVSSSISTVLTIRYICTFLSVQRSGTRKTISRCCFSMKFLQGNNAQDSTLMPRELQRKWMNSSAQVSVIVKGSSQMQALLRSYYFGPVLFINLFIFLWKQTFQLATLNFCSLVLPSSTSAVFLRYSFENLVLSFSLKASSNAALYLLPSFPSLSYSFTSQKYFPPAADSNIAWPCTSARTSSSSIEKLPCMQLSVVIMKGSEVASSSNKESMSWLLICMFSEQKFRL